MSETPAERGWISHMACGHDLPPDDGQGHIYGKPRPGNWITCLRCQGQRRVVSVEPAP